MAKSLTKILYSLILFSTLILGTLAKTPQQFIFNGFDKANLHLDGLARVHSNGLLQLTNTTSNKKGHAFYPTPLPFDKSLSFSTTFAFAIYPQYPTVSGDGITFVICPSINFRNAMAGEHFGLFNTKNDGLSTNHILAIELDTMKIPMYGDTNGNHVGIDINTENSTAAAPVSYFNDKDGNQEELRLLDGKPMKIWIDYDEMEMFINITIAPLKHTKPSRVLLSKFVNLTEVLLDSMYIGFSASTSVTASRHYIQGWSFSQNGQAQNLEVSKLPKLPPLSKSKRKLTPTSITLLAIVSFVLIIIVGAAYVKQRKKYEEVIEDWEHEYILQRLPYRDLYKATKGFQEKGLLGCGGFGKVYKGTLPNTKVKVAIKRVSHDSRQGMKEFVSEIASMRKLRHRNLVQLQGYCRRKGELLLVYDYMPNGSLDKFLFSEENRNLFWEQRIKIIKGVASALLYLHEEWEQIVLHRDVKASNVMLDANMNARLGDFGLARLYDHGTKPQTTHLVGTVGYLAPELVVTQKASTGTDVYAFGIFMLEVACGKRPIISQQESPSQIRLVEWVSDSLRKDAILEVSDPILEGYYPAEEMDLVLKLALLCSHSRPEARPTMRQVMQFLNRDADLPEIPPDRTGIGFSSSASFPSSSGNASIGSYYSTASVLRVGR